MTNASSTSPADNQVEGSPSRNVPALDEILGQKFPVLDDGFVRVVDYMGSDGAVVQAARVSYGAGTKRVHEDRGLIRYLLRHGHTTPFEMCELKLHLRVPMDCWRQWIRHRTANVNEYSTRYSVAIDAMQKTAASEWRAQATDNRQGSALAIPHDIGSRLSEKERELQQVARSVYEERIALGVAREQARKDLPLSTYTEAYWKIDLHNLFHFLRLRMDSHAQHEIRAFANVIGKEVVSRWCPIAWEAFNDYQLEAIHLTALEKSVLGKLAQGKVSDALEVLGDAGLLRTIDGKLARNRERDDLEHKLTTMGISAPW